MLKMSKRDIPVDKKEKVIELKRAGYTNASVAEHLGVHRNTVSRILSKQKATSTNEQELLATITKLINKAK